MYLITAIVNAECIKDILEDLKESEIEGVTLIEVKGKGGFISNAEEFQEHMKMEIVVSSDHFKELAKEAIRANARNLEKGSGKIWVTPVLEVERVRTGETGADALSHSGIEKMKSKNTTFYEDDTPAS